jgi:chromosome segregation ATPase
MDEARRVALRQAIQESSEMHAQARLQLDAKIRDLESEKAGLRKVLSEFEDTMNAMVSKENSNQSTVIARSEAEKNDLKIELLEVTEAFDKLKARYDAVKLSLSDGADREARLIDQNRDLKRSMVDLQKWSDALKANTEKKLASSFESASHFRTLYLDKETHLAKATQELALVKNAHAEREQVLSVSLANAAKLEANLLAITDTCKSNERAIAVMRESYLVSEAQRIAATKNVDEMREKLEAAEGIAVVLAGIDDLARSNEAKAADLVKENRALKARAYDDLTSVKSLQAQLKDKDNQCDELMTLVEELAAKLDKSKGPAK